MIFSKFVANYLAVHRARKARESRRRLYKVKRAVFLSGYKVEWTLNIPPPLKIVAQSYKHEGEIVDAYVNVIFVRKILKTNNDIGDRLHEMIDASKIIRPVDWD